MIKNFFHTRIPFYRCGAFTSQPMLQVNKVEATKNMMKAAPNPKDFYPEFIMLREWANTNITQVQIWNVTTDTLHSTINIALFSNASYSQQFQVDLLGGVNKIAVMFTGLYFVGNAMTCGSNYQYRITTSDGQLYHSEWWECHNVSFATNYHPYYTWAQYRSTCNFSKIRYSGLTNFYHNLWLKSDGMMPETSIQEETETTAKGDIVSMSHRVVKYMLLSLPHASAPMVDAINTLPLYAKGSQLQLYVKGRESGESNILVEDVEVEKPDYSLSEIAPMIKLRMQIDPALIDSGCCDTDSFVCYRGVDVPKPLITKLSTTSMKISIQNTALSNWFNLGKIPLYTLVEVYYRVVGAPSWTSGGTSTYLQLATGVTFTSLGTATYEAMIKIKPYGDTGSCESSNSETSLPVNLA